MTFVGGGFKYVFFIFYPTWGGWSNLDGVETTN